MPRKTARLTLLIEQEFKDVFEQICESQGLTPSLVVRQLIRKYISKCGHPEQLAALPRVVPDDLD